MRVYFLRADFSRRGRVGRLRAPISYYKHLSSAKPGFYLPAFGLLSLLGLSAFTSCDHRTKRLVYWSIVLVCFVLGFIVGMFHGSVRASLALSSWQQAKSWLLEGKVIVLDPGHGGIDPGAWSREHKILEKDIVLDIALITRDYLKAAGASVILTRETDTDLVDGTFESLKERSRMDLHKRAEIVAKIRPDAFLSIHANSFPSSIWYGAQTFYYKGGHPASKRLAELLQEELARQTQNTTRKASDRIDQYVLRVSEVPSATVEVGFLSNTREAELLSRKAFRERIAWSIFTALARFFAESP